jgi:plastocyanin
LSLFFLLYLSAINMRYSVAIVAAALTAAASATDFQVEVAPNGKLIYSPNSLTAMPGDMVTFRFNPKVWTYTMIT